MTITRLAHIARFYATVIPFKDKHDHTHGDNVSHIAARVARELKMTEDEVKLLELSSLVHDVGKLGIPDTILSKPGKLTEEELVVMHGHTIIGYEIMVKQNFSASVNRVLLPVCLNHHERWDGSGYPNSLIGEEVPLVARIVGMADMYDAIETNERSYQREDEGGAIQIMQAHAEQFEPRLLEIFVRLYNERK